MSFSMPWGEVLGCHRLQLAHYPHSSPDPIPPARARTSVALIFDIVLVLRRSAREVRT